MSPLSPGPLAASPRCWPAGETAQPAREPHTKLCTSASSLEGPRHIRSSNGPLSSRPLALRAPRACGWSVSTLALSPVAAESRRGRRRAPVRGNQGGGRRSTAPLIRAREVRRYLPASPSPFGTPFSGEPTARPTRARGVGLARLRSQGWCDLPPNNKIRTPSKPPLDMHKGLARKSGRRLVIGYHALAHARQMVSNRFSLIVDPFDDHYY